MDRHRRWPESILRLFSVLLAVALLMGSPPSLFAQGWGEYGQAAGLSALLPNFDLGRMNLRATTTVGYQRMGVNFNMPSFAPLSPGNDATVDLSLAWSDMWIGSVGVELDIFAPFLSLYVKAVANAPKSVAVLTSQSPLPLANISVDGSTLSARPPVTWPSSLAQWWVVDGGALYQYSEGMAVMAGLRRDHLSVNFSDEHRAGLALGSTAGIDYGGDFLQKLWIPYLGVQMNGPSYRTSFIWSPFVSVSLQAPLLLSIFVSVPPPTDLFLQVLQEFRYSVFNPGALFEANFEYSYQFGRGISFGVWADAGWFKLSDNGQLAAQAKVFIAPDTFTSTTSSDSRTATLTRHVIAGGISAEVKF